MTRDPSSCARSCCYGEPISFTCQARETSLRSWGTRTYAAGRKSRQLQVRRKDTILAAASQDEPQIIREVQCPVTVGGVGLGRRGRVAPINDSETSTVL